MSNQGVLTIHTSAGPPQLTTLRELSQKVYNRNKELRKNNALHLSWQHIDSACKELADHIRNVYTVDDFVGVLGVSKNGIIPATIIANELGINNIKTTNINDQDFSSNDYWLVIDALVESKKFVDQVHKLLPHGIFCSLIAKPDAIDHIDTFLADCRWEIWNVFPWER